MMVWSTAKATFKLVSSQYRRQSDFRCHILHHSPRRRRPLAMAQEGSQPAARHDREQNGRLLQSNDRATLGRNEGRATCLQVPFVPSNLSARLSLFANGCASHTRSRDYWHSRCSPQARMRHGIVEQRQSAGRRDGLCLLPQCRPDCQTRVRESRICRRPRG